MAFNGKKKPLPMAAVCAIGAGISLIFTFLASVLLAYLMEQGSVEPSGVSSWSLIITVISTAAGIWIATRIYKEQRLTVCGITGAGYYLTLIAVTGLFFGGQYQGMLAGLGMVFLGCVVNLLPMVLGKTGGKRHKFKGYR